MLNPCDQLLFPHDCRHAVWWNNLIAHAEECPNVQTHPLLCFANFGNKWSTVTWFVTYSKPKIMLDEQEKSHNERHFQAKRSLFCCPSYPYTSKITLYCWKGMWCLALPHHLLYVPNSSVAYPLLKDGKHDLRKEMVNIYLKTHKMFFIQVACGHITPN